MKTYLSIWLTMLVAGCVTTAAPDKVTANEAATWIAKTEDVQVVDVRRPDEFAAGHLKGATMVTWGDDDFEKQALAKVDKDQPVLVYCRSGRRSTAAAATLDKLGYKTIKNLDGGITAWKAAGKPVTTRQ